MQERVMFGPIFEPAIPPWCWSAGGGACDRLELPALLPRALRGHAPQEAVRGSLINPEGVRWRPLDSRGARKGNQTRLEVTALGVQILRALLAGGAREGATVLRREI